MRALILLLTACAPSDPRVTTTAFDGGFGPLASAVWIRTVYEAGVSEGLMLGNVPDLCEKNAALADARATFSAAAEAEDAACGPLTEPYLDAVDAAAAIYAPAAHYLLLDARLSAGRHDVGDDAFGALLGFSGPPVAALADAWDPDSTYAAHCGLSGDPRALLSPEPEPAWALGSGALRLTSVTDAAIRGAFGGELLDGGGEITATFDAQRCEIPAD